MLSKILHPLNVAFLADLDRISSERSIQEAMRWWLDECRVDLKVTGAPLPESGPVIIVGNHHGIFDLPALWAHTAREDVYFIGMRGAAKYGREIAARLFPVYMSQKPSRYLFERIKNHTFYRIREGIGREEAVRRNRENASRAAQRVAEGGCLILFPTAGTYVDTSMWKHGIGHLIAEIENPDLRIVFTHIKGSSRKDLLYLFNPYWFFLLRQRSRKMSVKIHDPIGIGEFRDHDTPPKEISARLRDRYLEIFGGL